MGSQSVLASSYSDLLFTKRNESYDIAVEKTCSVELFEKLTEFKVVGFPPQTPTTAPTYLVGLGFTWGTSEITSMSTLFEG